MLRHIVPVASEVLSGLVRFPTMYIVYLIQESLATTSPRLAKSTSRGRLVKFINAITNNDYFLFPICSDV